MNENEKNAVIALESFDSEKINETLKQAEQNPALKERLEKRYLNVIRAVLNKPEASLNDFALAFTVESLSKIRGDVFYPDANKIEFVYLSDEESRFVVDFVGGIVRNHVSVNDYIEACSKTENLNGIGTFLFPNLTELHSGIDAEVNLYPEGWYGQICISLMKSMIFGIEEFVIMKSWLKSANASDYLKDFNFFLAACSEKDYIFVQFRNVMDAPLSFTEVLWLYPNVPVVFYPADSEFSFPPCVLTYDRFFKHIKVKEFYNRAGDVNIKQLIDENGVIEVASSSL